MRKGVVEVEVEGEVQVGEEEGREEEGGRRRQEAGGRRQKGLRLEEVTREEIGGRLGGDPPQLTAVGFEPTPLRTGA